MPWYFYLLEFLAGRFWPMECRTLCRASADNPFQSPFAKPPGVGESSPLSNVLWGFGNLVAGALLLHFFWPYGRGGLVVDGSRWAQAHYRCHSVVAMHFGKVRAGKL
jgi:hypothetical protein